MTPPPAPLRCPWDNRLCGQAKKTGKKWIEDDDNVFFELRYRTVPPGMQNVEAVAMKTYLREVMLLQLYFEGSWYAAIRDASTTNPLLDTDFPDLTQRGRCFQLRGYDLEDFMQVAACPLAA